MNTFVRLVEVVVTHDYFSSAAPCCVDFSPDRATSEWLRRSGCLLRKTSGGLAILCDAARFPVIGRTSLTFAAHARDPYFDHYTAPAYESAGLGAPRVFDTRFATATATDGRFDLDPVSPAERDATATELAAATAFIVTIATDHPPGTVFRIALSSRSVRWKYLLLGDWSAARPVIAGDAAAFTRQADVVLANGQSAIVFRSNRPIKLGDKNARTLRSHDEHGPILISSLPRPDPANIVRENPADPASLVAEIYLSR